MRQLEPPPQTIAENIGYSVSAATKIILIYAAFSSLWILVSDSIVSSLFSDPRVIGQISIAKGWLFVAVTALLLYGLIRRLQIQAQRISESELAAQRGHADSEIRTRALYQSIPDLVWFKDTDGVYLSCNSRFEQFFGAPENAIVGKSDYDFVDKDLADAFRKYDQVAMEKGGPSRNEEWVTFASDGHRELLEATKTPVLDSKGQIIGVLGIGRDISERKSRELALIESEARWKFAIEGSGDGLWEWNIQTGKAIYSPRYKSMLGYVEEEIGDTADEWKKRIHPDDAPGVFAALQPYMEGKAGSVSVEFRMLRKDGRWMWTLWRGMVMERDAEGKSLRMIGTNSDITERKQAESQIEALAFSDPLTNLPNRRLLMDRLEQALTAAHRHAHQVALLFIDLDNFKTLNDTLGHDKGDSLLKQVAQRLISCVREGDTVARLGGDEFVVLLEDLSKNAQEAASQTQVVTAKILNAVVQPYDIEGHGHHSTASIGVAMIGGADRESIEEPLKRAELAMYQAKAAGRNTLRFFEPEMATAVTSRATLEAELREAVTSGRFVLFYQPQVGHDGRLTGVEALVRWQHPQRGLVSPAEFIPIAEASGLILPLGRWVLETACKQLSVWAGQPERSHLTIAINVSARQFRQLDFVETVLTILNANGAKPERLKIELTESVLVDNVEDVILKMNALKAKGVGFSIDDFGTGYSSLSYLKRLPLDQLKIDQGFVRDILSDPNDAAIARMVVVLADSLGLSVIAEGVETEAQRDCLANLGCNKYQGYLFGRPLPIQEFEKFFEQVLQVANS